MIIWIAIGAGSLLFGLLIGLLAPRIRLSANKKKLTKQDLKTSYDELVKEDVYHIFDKEFHEQLAEEARRTFQSVVDDNTATLKEQLAAASRDIDEQLKKEVTDKFQGAFSGYTQAIAQAQQEALSTIKASVDAVTAQQSQFGAQMQQDVEARKAALITGFQQNMAEIVSHYVLQAIGQKLDMKAQMPLILSELASQQEAMKRDMQL